MKILVISGPNLNLLGKRDESHYGVLSLASIEELLKDRFPSFEFFFCQSNHEGGIIDAIQNAEAAYGGIVINPGGYSHTSVAIRDALAECRLPKVEVHLSHLAKREDFRQKHITAQACDGYLSGFKEKGYVAAVHLLQELAGEND